LLATNPNLAFSVSATTRAQRPNEVHGKDYYFLSLEDFKEKLFNDEFLEHEQVYERIFYGTLKSEIQRIHGLGKSVIFDVDVKGGLNLKKYFKEEALAVFVKVKSIDILAERLQNRNTETPEKRAERIAKANQEILFEKEFDAVLINDNLEETLKKAEDLINHFLAN
jgi:guanylate kinase